MKNVILLLLCLFIPKDDYQIKVMSTTIKDDCLRISLKNDNSFPFVFFYGVPISDYKIYDNKDEITPIDIVSTSSNEDYLDYQFDFSKKLINETMDRYSISFDDAIMYLHYKNKHVTVSANQTRMLNLNVLQRNYTSVYSLDSTINYYLVASVRFDNSYVPKFIKDSLRQKSIEIIQPTIETQKIEIDLNRFFRKKNGFYRR